ncbi:MAG: ATP-binding protein [Gemmatimonadota bacterium]|nr:ATP-binding protein [Gemmatimonadota bacterium]
MNPGPVVRMDLEGKVELANRAAVNTFGLGELVGKNWLELSPQLLPGMWSTVLEGTDSLQYEAEISGQTYVFTLAHREDTESVFAYGTDISDRTAVQRELAKKSVIIEEMAQFPDMNPGPVVRVDREGTIKLANGAAQDLFENHDLVGESWLTLCPEIGEDIWPEVLASKEPVVKENRVRDKNLVFTLATAKAGTDIFIYGTDITTQKSAERALRQSEKMATLGTLAAGIAHELNNPAAAAQRAADHMREEFSTLQDVQSQISCLNLSEAEQFQLAKMEETARANATKTEDFDAIAQSDLENECEDWLEDHDIKDGWELAPTLVTIGVTLEELEYSATVFSKPHLGPALQWMSSTFLVYRLLDEIRRGTASISEIVGALKSYSYLGQAPVQSVDINESLRNTLVILRSKLKQGIKVVQDLDETIPKIEAYGGELNQVWTNLIDNAVSAMNGSGELTVRSEQRNGYITVKIEDDGPGISEDHIAQIFDAFFTTKPPGEGTGLGLHTCYNIVVNKHGGSIDVKSKPGWTCFLVSLPINAAPARNN